MNAHALFRRRFLVHKRYQLCHACGLALLAGINGGLLLFLLVWLFVFHADGRMLSPVNEHVAWYMVGGLLLTSLITVVWSLWHTRTLVGLLHKVVVVLGPLGQGASAPSDCICIRKEDKGFEQVEVVLNAVVERIRVLETSACSAQHDVPRQVHGHGRAGEAVRPTVHEPAECAGLAQG